MSEKTAVEQAIDALEAARIFIQNGVALGFIRMPDMKEDPALRTPGLIDDALKALCASGDADSLLDPQMPAQQLRLHMGELTAAELRVARSAIAFANSRRKASGDVDVEALKTECHGAASAQCTHAQHPYKWIDAAIDHLAAKGLLSRESAWRPQTLAQAVHYLDHAKEILMEKMNWDDNEGQGCLPTPPLGDKL